MQPAQTSCLVLIAENEGLIGLDLQEELEGAGYEVAGPFSTCTDAVQWLKRNTPDIAVVDIHLRDGACVELARELTKLQVPIAVYSGERQSAMRPEFKEAKWIEKPADASTLLAAVAGLRLPSQSRTLS